MASYEKYDVVVVGAGVEGSSTAYYLVKNGVKRVLLVEQFHALHTRGSSHGESRGRRISAGIGHHQEFLTLLSKSSELLSELEKEAGIQLFIEAGVLSFGPQDCPVLKKLAGCLQAEGRVNSIISSGQVNESYSAQLHLPDDYIAVWEPHGGVLKATEMLSVFQDLFVKGGGVLLDDHCVTDILPAGDTVTVRTNRGDFLSRKVIITAGGWAPKLLRKLGVELPLKVQRAEVLYWKVDNPEMFGPEKLPWTCYEIGEEHYYVFPVFDYHGLVKVYHRVRRSIDPDYRDEGGVGPESVDKVAQFIRTYMKGVSTTPPIFEPCIYTMTEDKLPIIDRVPGHPNCIYAAGMSGRGFMICTGLGLLLSNMALDKPLFLDISSFKIARLNSDANATV